MAGIIVLASDIDIVATETQNLKFLNELIQADQLSAVRRSILISIPINIALAAIIMVVTVLYGHVFAGVAWFAATCVINALRIGLCRSPLPGSPAKGILAGLARLTTGQHLMFASILALISGSIWALMPLLCDGYTAPQAVFYLVVICGITAGAVTHGNAYAIIPSCFILPPLLSMAGCMVYAGGVDHIGIAFATILYLGALIRSARESHALFREASRRKNEATSLAGSLTQAHARTTEIAEEMHRRAIHDTLTGLLNRAGFANEVETLMSGLHKSLCLMILDLDGFKSVNDVFGHRAGDDVLIEVAVRLRQTLPNGFTIARLGGDEFAIIFDPEASCVQPREVADRLISAIGRPFPGFDSGRVGVSIGIHQTRNRVGFSEMMICADSALYAAKSGGRNRHYMFDEQLNNRLNMRRDVERDLPKALADGQLYMVYQPIMNEGGRRLSNFEALLRWDHPRHGSISPVDIVEIAAVLGLSEALMKHILTKTGDILTRLMALGRTDIWVAVNVSPREMSRLPVDAFVLNALKAQGIPTSMLEIEVTEETAMDIRAVQGKLSVLSQAGIRVAIDDFGVGYSSLSSLRHLQVDRIKIDNSFVTELTRSSADQLMVQAIINLGHSLDMEVVAEGVETAEIQAMLQTFGCRVMQGYHLGHPMTPDVALNWMSQLVASENLKHSARDASQGSPSSALPELQAI
ncbi:bifunctional diguanylate cyclase/phosphodiesterase [Asticcacaulis sp. 201]|uniref:putative bifunctional diguanylate cyclase/phosphodiesterase n=1 Tax=Asticcacaulis sp. 201 TaxID=3028787 RepID=UPI002916335B|nr:bifunctional diguanylate cyclase/phosphodiesterase [Asticcacaulis sp. 201]MDV6333050.1 bifunctional diguanylate cyclase/phosphodiesterase [Asticcacaulis sp. 201]